MKKKHRGRTEKLNSLLKFIKTYYNCDTPTILKERIVRRAMHVNLKRGILRKIKVQRSK